MKLLKNLLQTDKSKIIVKEIGIDIQSIDDEDDKEYMNDREGVNTVNASSIGVTNEPIRKYLLSYMLSKHRQNVI